MIHIITDSLSDFTQEQAKDLGITLIPLSIHFGTEVYLDGVDIDKKKFYDKLAQSAQLPKTSQVTPDAFAKAYREALARYEEVLVMTGSSEISGTYQSACIARDMLAPATNIHVVDTLNATAGQAQLVRQALRMIREGMNIERIVEVIRRMVPRIKLEACVDTLKYLHMGGRLSAVGAKVGTVLKIKPLVRVKDGKVESAGVARNMKRGCEWIVQQYKDNPPDPASILTLASSNAPESVEVLRQLFQDAGLLPPQVEVMEIGSTVGTHAGPGCVAAVWLAAK